jgi:DNA polymerase (family X)
MDWRWWPMAKEKGVRCSINPDAHSINGLKDLYFGVGIARKGWLTRADVINCLDVDRVRDQLNAKRDNA